MTVLVVQNYHKTGLGLLLTALDEASVNAERIAAHEGGALPDDHDAHDAIIVLGGGQNALDDEGSPWLPHLVKLMRSFALEGKAVLGICLGSQLLARALGAENSIGTASEFSWQEVGQTEEGRDDPLFAGVPERFPVFQWHDDTFSLPDSAVRIATGEKVRNQGFRWGRAAYGLQFHFEADRSLVQGWTVDFEEHLRARQPGWLERYPEEAARHGAAADAAGLAIARNWVSLIKR